MARLTGSPLEPAGRALTTRISHDAPPSRGVRVSGTAGLSDYGPRSGAVLRLLEALAEISDWPAVAAGWRNRPDELWREDASMELVSAVAAEEGLGEILARSARAAERRTLAAWKRRVPLADFSAKTRDDAVMAVIQAVVATAILERARFDDDYRRLVGPLGSALPWLLDDLVGPLSADCSSADGPTDPLQPPARLADRSSADQELDIRIGQATLSP